MMRDLFAEAAKPAKPVFPDPVGKFAATLVDGKLIHPCYVCGAAVAPFGLANHEYGLWACGAHRAQVMAMR